jgi:hypothetical protein
LRHIKSAISNQPFGFCPSGLIEFERIEPKLVAKQLEAAPEHPFDTDPLSINFERLTNHKPNAAERMLAGSTIDWLVAFPVDARPKALCERFPHVANGSPRPGRTASTAPAAFNCWPTIRAGRQLQCIGFGSLKLVSANRSPESLERAVRQTGHLRHRLCHCWG